ESRYLVLRLTPGRQHQNRRDETGVANGPAYRQTVPAGQHDIEDDQVERQTCRLRQTFLAVCRVVDPITFIAQTVADSHAQGIFVFDEQEARMHITPSSCTILILV